MDAAILSNLRNTIRDIVDFPQPGVIFKDITPVLNDANSLQQSIQCMSTFFKGHKIDKVVGIDARGFIFGAMLAHHLKCGFVPARKKGKLPWQTRSMAYALEYGEAELQLHDDALQPGEKVILADDLLATGGTAAAALHLIQSFNVEFIGSVFFIELDFLKGRTQVEAYGPVHSVLQF